MRTLLCLKILCLIQATVISEACKSHPCLNGGCCLLDTCFCTDGFEGANCETVVQKTTDPRISESIKACIHPLYENSGAMIHSNATTLKAVCRYFHKDFKTCLAPYKHLGSKEDTVSIQSAEQQFNFYCNGEGTELYIRHEDCLKTTSAWEAYDLCNRNFAKQVRTNDLNTMLTPHEHDAAHCRSVKYFLSCLNETFSDVCGTETGYLMYESDRYRNQAEFEQIDCYLEPYNIIQDTDMNIVAEIRTSERIDYCMEQLQPKYTAQVDGSLDTLESKCHDFHDVFLSCVAPYKNNCSETHRKTIQGTEDLLNFQCDETSKTKYKKHGQCIASETVRHELLSCKETFMLRWKLSKSKPDLCRATKTWLGCQKTAVKKYCGTDAAYLVYESYRKQKQPLLLMKLECHLDKFHFKNIYAKSSNRFPDVKWIGIAVIIAAIITDIVLILGCSDYRSATSRPSISIPTAN